MPRRRVANLPPKPIERWAQDPAKASGAVHQELDELALLIVGRHTPGLASVRYLRSQCVIGRDRWKVPHFGPAHVAVPPIRCAHRNQIGLTTVLRNISRRIV